MFPAVPHTKAARRKVRRVMHEYKHRKLYTSGGRLVRKKAQAVRIALEEARRMTKHRRHRRNHPMRKRHHHARRRRHRRNPPAGNMKWLAFGLIGFGLYLMLKPSPASAGGYVGTGTTAGGSFGNIFDSLGGITTSIGNIFGGMFDSANVGGVDNALVQGTQAP